MIGTLSIGIPVFNGALELETTLSSIESIEEFKSGELEVVISDNQSQDDSFQVATAFARKYPQSVRLSQNLVNLLFRKNLAVLCSLSKSKYIWFIGVGEQITATSLRPLVSFLESPQGSNTKMGVLATSNLGQEKFHPSEKWNIEQSTAYSSNCFSEAISLVLAEVELASRVLQAGEPDNKIERVFWPHLEMAIAASAFPTFQLHAPGLVSIAQNNNGWWYHSKYAISVYVKQLEILEEAQALQSDNWWASSLWKQRRGWHFAALVFEASVGGIGVSAREVLHARRAGVRLAPTAISILITFSPKWILRVTQRVKRRLV
jgi:glycosyltransferase involved in cell wall biosynthesis